MDRRLRNRLLFFLLAAAILAYLLFLLSGRQPVTKLSAVVPSRENIVSSISSNGKVEPISPFVMRAQLDTFVEKVSILEGQQVKKGQLLLELNVKDAAALLAQARARHESWKKRQVQLPRDVMPGAAKPPPLPEAEKEESAETK